MDFRIVGAAALLLAASLAAPAAAATADAPKAAATMATAPATKLRAYKSDLTSVPALDGVPLGRVDALLESARLARGATRYESRSGVAAGVVIGQSPAAGTAVKLGAPVDIVVSVAPSAPERTRPSAGPDATTSKSGSDAVGAVLGQVLQELLKPRPAASAAASPERDVTVPDLVGRTLESQAALLRERRLGIESVTERAGADPAGVVVAQRPAAGARVPPGTRLTLETSRGPPPRVVVPDVVGVDEAVAQQRLAARKLPFETLESPSTQADGRVLAQNPAAGAEVAPGTTVRLRVSDGSLVVVPPLVGATAESAAEALARVDLRAGTQTRESPRPPGQVVAQQPPAGSSVRRGSTVRIWIAVAQRIAVPDLAGLTLDDAAARLGKSLRAQEARRVDSMSVPADRIAGQEPAPGTLVDVGSTVHVDLSQGPPPLADLQGKTPDEARDAVAQTGTQLGTPQRAFDAAPSGTVIGQSPPAGVRLPPGSVVTIIVSRGPLWPWIAGAAAALLVLTLAGAAKALWPPLRYRVSLQASAAGARLQFPTPADGPALALRAHLERGVPALVMNDL